MKYLTFLITFLAGALLMVNIAKGQSPTSPENNYSRAVEEVENILSSAGKLNNPLAIIKVKSKAANLLWAAKPERARAVFMELWEFINAQTDKSFDQEEARLALLQNLYPKDQALARRLMDKIAGPSSGDDKVSAVDKLLGNTSANRRTALLANRLLEADITLASSVLEQSLAGGVAPLAQTTLSQLRAKDPLLANHLTARAIRNLEQSSPTSAVTGLGIITNYLFPLVPSFTFSPEASESDENLRSLFVNAGYQALKASLAEAEETLLKEQGFTPASLKTRIISQTVLAATLTALAPRYAPLYLAELTAITARLLNLLPPNLVELVKAQASAVKGSLGTSEEAETDEVSEGEIINALTKQDFNKAQSLIDRLKDENKKALWTGLLLKTQSNAYLDAGDLIAALNTARKLQEPVQRMQLLVGIAKATHKKRDAGLAVDLLLEARRTKTDALPKAVHAVTLFALSADIAYFSAPESSAMLQQAIGLVNALKAPDASGPNENAPRALRPDDPNRLLNSMDLARAFSVLGELNLDETLSYAGRLEYKPVQMAARLAAVEKILRKGPPKAKRSPEIPAKMSG
jgi:hypothetical protein